MPAAAAGRWYDFSALAYADCQCMGGTALNWRTCDETTGNGTQILASPTAATWRRPKHIVNAMAVTPVVPGVLMLVDMRGYYPAFRSTAPPLRRWLARQHCATHQRRGRACVPDYYRRGWRNGCNIAYSYTNSAGASGKTNPVTVAGTASAIVSHLALRRGGQQLRAVPALASGDSGIQSVQSVTLSAASGAGTAALALVRTIAIMPITTAGVAVERDLSTSFRACRASSMAHA